MKRFAKITKFIALVLAFSMLFGTVVFAEEDDGLHFDFGMREIHLAPGEMIHVPVYASDEAHGHRDDFPTYSVYMVGKTSDKSYVWSDFLTGASYVDIFIGEDETAKDITLYFYIDETGIWSNINVHIVEPEKSDVSPAFIDYTYSLMGISPVQWKK